MLRRLTHRFLRNAGLPDSLSVSVLLVGDRLMKSYNRTLFNTNTLTDVISIRYPPLPGEPSEYAEIILNVDEAARHPTLPGGKSWSFAHELCLYLAHGCDHLSGWDDRTPAGRRRMRRRELRWLRDAERDGLIQNLIKPATTQ